MINDGVKRERYWIAWDDPASARAEFHWSQKLQRGDWKVRTELTTRLERSEAGLHLQATLEAFDDTEICYSRTWNRGVTKK